MPNIHQLIVDNLLLGVLVIEADSCIFTNKGFSSISGYSNEEILTLKPGQYKNLFARGETPQMFSAIGSCLSADLEKPAVFDCQCLMKSGKAQWVTVIVYAAKLDAQNLAVLTIQDNHEKIQSQINLKASNDMFQLVLEAIPSRVFWKDRDSRYLGCNLRFAKDAGKNTIQEVIGDFDDNLGWKEQAKLYKSDDQSVMNSGQPKIIYEEPQSRPSGQTNWLRTSKIPLRDAEDNIIGVLGTYEDITETVRMREAFRHSQKMDAIGRLAGGVAHDFNNMLSGIIGYAELLAVELKDNPDLKQYADYILNTAGRSASLTQKLLAFSRKSGGRSESVNVNNTITEAVSLLEQTIDKRIEILTQFNAARSNIMGDYSQIQSIFINLGVNARDAMPHGGTLSFQTDNIHLDESFCIRSQFELKPGEHICITVKDTGCGVDKEHLDKIFDPFFTTKEVGRGTGLGLSAIYGTVQEHQGAVQVSSEPNRGSEFRVYLPVSDLPETQKPDMGEMAIKGSETILVVDDELIIRTVVSKVLENLGYHVLLAKDGVEAIAVFKENRPNIDLVLLDMIMPKQDGADTFFELKKIDASLKIIISSGYSEETELSESIQQAADGFLPKPISRSKLGRTIRMALGNS